MMMTRCETFDSFKAKLNFRTSVDNLWLTVHTVLQQNQSSTYYCT